MLIENPESLQTWLTSYLEPLCDADPQALAQYVMALIGKDKPTNDLKHILSEQLEVFLQKETVPFVEVLFETIENKSYLEPVHSDSHSGSPDISPSGLDGEDGLQSSIDNYGVHGNLGSPLESNEYEPKSIQHLPDSNASGSQLASSAHSKRSYHNRERSKSRSHSRSRSPPAPSAQTRHRPRDVDMRRPGNYNLSNQGSGGSRGHFTDERNRRTGWNSPSSRGMSRRYGTSSTSSSALTSSSHLGTSYRRNQQQTNRRSRSRSKSLTPSRSRSRSYSPQPNRSPSHDRGRTKDKSRSSNRSHNRVQSTSRSRSRNRDGPVSKRTRVSSKSPVNEEVEEDNEEKPSFTKKRCRDYDERGFCMRGDLCQFDHGSDPVVLDGDVSSVVLGLTANGASSLAAPQSITTSGSANFLNEPYNPEAPGIDKPIKTHGNRRGSGVGSLGASLRGPVPSMGNNYNHISQHQFWRPIAPPSLRPLPPGSSSSSFIPSMSQSNRPRELVGVVTLSEGGKNLSTTLTKINPDLTKIMNKSTMVSSTPTLTPTSTTGNLINSVGLNSHHHNNSSTIMSKRGGNSGRGGGSGSGHRGGFRGGYVKRMVNNESADKCTLEVRKIPPNLNTIANLNSHFSKFGSIVNLQVCYDGDSEAALVQFASHSEALSAHRCTEAVLNNRFIKVFWHSKDQSSQQQSQQQQQQSSSHSLTNQGPGHHHHLQHKSSYDPSLRAANGGITNESNKSDQINSNSRPNIKDRLGLRHGLDSDKSSAPTNVNSTGAISRTVFNPSLLKKQYPSSTTTIASSSLSSSAAASSTTNTTTTTTTTATPSTVLSTLSSTSGVKQETGLVGVGNPVSETLIKRKEDSKKDKLLKKLDLQKKRQNILVSCMQQQKRLIEKLQKAKTDKDKIELRSMVDLLNKQIKGLESDIKKDAEIILAEASKLPSSGNIKSKIQVEKELLDVEMDFYNELHKGATASELHKKLQELKIKAKPYCMNDIRSTKAMIKRFAEMKGALRDRNRQANHTLAKNFENLRKVDRRTRKIFIENIPEDDNNILLTHLSQSAEIESLESTPQGLLVTFRTRRDAEMALPLIATVKLKDQAPKLKASWFDEVKAKTEEMEIAHSLEKVSSQLESELIENDTNVNNDESRMTNKDEEIVVETELHQEEDLKDDGDLVEGEEEKTEDKYSNEPQKEEVKEEHGEEGEEEEDSSSTEIDEDPRNQETDDDGDDGDDNVDDNQVSPKGEKRGGGGVEEGYVVVEREVNKEEDEDEDEDSDDDDTINDEEEEERPPTANKVDETISPDELQLGVGVEDDLLEEEETDDEDESRAWRR